MPVDHYENFPVASVLLPRALRAPIEVVYRFARQADDLADEGDASTSDRLAALGAYDAQLDRIAAGQPPAAAPDQPLFTALSAVITHYRMPIALFHDLLSAFMQDVAVERYADFTTLLDYCRRSANPVGRLMLVLYGADTAQHRAWSDHVCTSLQLINFWQDVAVDRDKGRIYLPLEDLARFEVDRARTMMMDGAPLARALGGRIGLELRFIVQGGLRILEKIEQVDYDVFDRRPRVTRADLPSMAWRALTMRR